jgi:hypothetical protein
MPATCRADVEALLRARKLDRTLVAVTATSGSVVVPETIATGYPSLDQQLGGGLPMGHMSEITGPRSSGRSSLLLSLLAEVTGRGELAALVDTFDTFDPASAAAAGVRLEHLLWVRGESCTPAFPGLANRQSGADRAIERGLKALNLVLQAGGFSLAVLDLADAPALALRHVPMNTWMRLQRVLDGQSTAGLVLAPMPIARSAGGVTLALTQTHGTRDSGLETRDANTGTTRATGEWAGAREPLGMFRGLTSEVHVQRARLVPGHDGAPVRLRAVPHVA